MELTNDAGEFLDNILSGKDEKIIIKKDKEMSEYFRRVFSTQEGQIVLQQILTDLKFFDECVDEADTALNNYAKFMIFKRLRCDNKKNIKNMFLKLRGIKHGRR